MASKEEKRALHAERQRRYRATKEGREVTRKTNNAYKHRIKPTIRQRWLEEWGDRLYLLSQLSDRHCQVLQWYYVEGLDIKDIGDRLQLSPEWTRRIKIKAEEELRTISGKNNA